MRRERRDQFLELHALGAVADERALDSLPNQSKFSSAPPIPVEVEAETSNLVAAQSHTAGPEEDVPVEGAPELNDAPIPFSVSDPFPRLHWILEQANQASTPD